MHLASQLVILFQSWANKFGSVIRKGQIHPDSEEVYMIHIAPVLYPSTFDILIYIVVI